MKVLFVEDQPADADLTRRALARSAPEIELTLENTLAGAIARLDEVAAGRRECDLVLADVSLPDGSGVALLAEVRARRLPAAVVILTGSGSEVTAAEAMRAGADDYVTKRGDYLESLPQTLRAALQQHRAEARRRARPLHILFLEPDEQDAQSVRLALRRDAHLRLRHVHTAASALQLLDSGAEVDALLTDFELPDGSVFDLIKDIRQRRQSTLPIVLNTRAGDEETAAQALRLGANDYLVKTPGYHTRLAWSLENACLRAEASGSERALHERESHFRSLIENLSDLITTLDANGRVVFQSVSVSPALGLPVDEVTGRRALRFVHPKDRPHVLQELRRALREPGLLFGFPVRLRHRDGTWRHFEVRGRSAAAVSRPTQLILNSRDVTEQAQLEVQYRHAQKLEAVGHLSAGIAHDFNNLLSIVQLNAALLSQLVGTSPDEIRAVRGIEHACERGAQLTRQLLVFSRREQIQFADVELNGVIAGISPMLTRVLGEALKVQTALAPGELHSRADAGMLEQVLVNLAVNARDAMPGGGTLRIETSTVELEAASAPLLSAEARPGSFACLSFSDTGCGISADVLPHIFEPFYTTKAPGQGTGLGLAVVYGIVKQHTGWVQVQSTPGRGTTFRIYLPRFDPPPAAVVPAAAKSPPRGRGETILVVEDERSLRLIVQLTLEHFGYRVLVAATGAEALEVWRQHRGEIALVLTDLVMPDGMNGRELAEQLLAERPDLPVIFTSGYSANLSDDLDPEVNFVSKPVEGAKLASILRRRLDAR